MNAMVRGWGVLLMAQCLFAQPPGPGAEAAQTELLSRIVLKMAANLSGLPNYTCTQTIERAARSNPSKRYKLLDVIRLEVALVDGTEMFAWPGETRFEDRELRDLVKTGAIGNGNFALHAKAVFQGRGVRFTYGGEAMLEGTRAIRFDYRVPQAVSGFTLRSGELEGIAGYRGSVWVDRESLDLLRLDVITTEIPGHLPVKTSSNVLEYARMPIGERSYVLPKSSEMVIVDLQGNESRNQVSMSRCRQYMGESTLIFEDAPHSEAEAVRVTEFDVPEGIDLDVNVQEAPSLSDVAIGDPIRGVLRRPAKRKGEVVVPKGAIVRGRVTRLQRGDESGVLLLGLEVNEVEFAGRRGRVKGHLMEAGVFPVLDSWSPAPVGSTRTMLGRMRVPADPRNLVAVTGSGLRSRLTVRMVWHTEAVVKERE